jgi:hypothetical protein
MKPDFKRLVIVVLLLVVAVQGFLLLTRTA